MFDICLPRLCLKKAFVVIAIAVTIVTLFNLKSAEASIDVNSSKTMQAIQANSGVFQPYVTRMYEGLVSPNAVATGDVNGDKFIDVIVADFNGVFVFLQNPATSELGEPIKYATGNATSVEIGDFNNDNKDDIAVGTIDGIQVIYQDEDGNIDGIETLNPGNNLGDYVNFLEVGDFDNDGRTDIACLSNYGFMLYIQDASGNLKSPDAYSIPDSGYSDIASGDVNGDGRDDIVLAKGLYDTLYGIMIFPQTTTGTLGSPTTKSINYQCSGIDVGDINNDGLGDIVVSQDISASPQGIKVFLQNSNHELNPAIDYVSYNLPEAVKICYVDSDERNDVLAVHGYGWKQLGVYLQAGNGTLNREGLYGIAHMNRITTKSMATGDINGDGSPDAILLDSENGLTILYNSESLAINTNISTDIEPDIDTQWFTEFPNVRLINNLPATTYYQWDSTATASWTEYTADFEAQAGEHVLYFYSTNNEETESVKKMTFKVDAGKPVFNQVQFPAGPAVSDTITINALADDTVSGLDSAYLFVDDEIVGGDMDLPYTFELESWQFMNGYHDVGVLVYDKAGNYDVRQVRLNFKNSIAPPIEVSSGTDSTVYPGLGIIYTFSRISSDGNMQAFVDESIPKPNPAQYTIIGSVYNSTASFAYAGDIIVEIPYDPNMASSDSALPEVIQWNGVAWEEITFMQDMEYASIIGLMDRLRPFAVVKKNPSYNPGGGGSQGGAGGSGGGGADSQTDEIIKKKTTISAPADLKATATSSRITLRWDVVVNAAKYNIYRKDGPDGVMRILGTSIRRVSYVDTTAKPGIVYTYYVSAVSSDSVESGGSNAVDANLIIVEGVKTFADVKMNAWHQKYISDLAGRKILQGYSDGTFRPDAAITRAEFAKAVCIAMGWEREMPETSSFTDVGKIGWAYSYIEAVRKHGAILGYPDRTFAPNKKITRAEIAKIIATVKNLNNDKCSLIDVEGHWAKQSISACVNAGIVSGYANKTFMPDNPATRAEAARMIYGIIPR